MSAIDALRAARLYGIVDLGCVAPERAAGVTDEMIQGGIEVLQLRAKDSPIELIRSLAGVICPLTRAAGVPFIINDYPEIVVDHLADGAHVGQDDIGVEEARSLAFPGAIIGKSTHSLEQAAEAEREGADYIGFGPLFATPTKPDYTPIGLDDVPRAHSLISLPIFCIGGIKLGNLDQVLAAGAKRVVIVTGILHAPAIGKAVRDCRQRLGAL